MIDLSKLALPFPAEDIEWRVSRAGMGKSGIYCQVLAYITARAIQQRLDDVCGPENWCMEAPKILDMSGKPAFACGLSIRTDVGSGHEWLTKYDVSEPTNIEPAKGGWSGAMKRAGAQWGIGRYLYHLDEAFAETAEYDPKTSRGWHYAKLPEKHGGGAYYWREPQLPAWALPKEEADDSVSATELNTLKKEWKDKFAPEVKNRSDLMEGFNRFVTSILGDFPVADPTCWTHDALAKCRARINSTTEPNGVSSDVPFEE
jgi:hypothetical protein